MIETCPFCHNAVLFLNSICPSCRGNKDDSLAADPAQPSAEFLQRQQEIADRQTLAALQDAERASARNDMGTGAAWVIGGFCVTLFSHATAVNTGGETYVLMWGPWIYGGIRFLCGLRTYLFSPILNK